mmetsp:Transcript_5643/g.12370  ORF Transcript_5643/g.12370 Transcript_5643/m.12370 type:complete len:233 (-) Transcript_5643:399-1097(-)
MLLLLPAPARARRVLLLVDVQPRHLLPIQHLQVVEALTTRAAPPEEVQPPPQRRERHARAGVGLHPQHPRRAPRRRGRVEDVNVVEALGPVPPPEDEELRGPGGLEEGGGVVGALLGGGAVGPDGAPSVGLDVEGVEVVQILAAIPSPKDVDLATGGDEVGRMHIARTRGGSQRGRLKPPQSLQPPRNIQHPHVARGQGSRPQPSPDDDDLGILVVVVLVILFHSVVILVRH